MRALPSLSSLTLVTMLKLKELPDVATMPKLLAIPVVLSHVMCCNGFLGACDVTHPYCQWANYTTVDCLDTSAIAWTPGLDRAVAAAKAVPISCLQLPGAPDRDTTSVASRAAQCDGKRWKQCAMSDGEVGVCFEKAFQLLSCGVGSGLGYAAMRREQIRLGVGDKCDPTVEAWLGCKNATA